MKRLAFLLAAFVLVAAPAAAKDTLTVGITQFPSTFHPNIDEMLAKSYILGATRRPFTTHDPDWRLMCMLCVELPTLENGGAKREVTPDGKQGVAVTFRIQPNARWGDGVPITADDAVFTWRAGRHPKSGFTGEEFYRRVWKVTPVDPKTFTLHFDKVFFDYNSIGGFEVLPAHLEQHIFDERPEEYRNRTNYVIDPTNPGLYFGPYRIAQVSPGSHVVLEPNESWWGRRPYFRRVTIRAIENTAALEANLLSTAIDMIDGDLGLAIDEALAFEKRHGQRYAIAYKSGLIYEHIDLNLANPILADVRVRKALLHGADRRQISDKLFGGRQPVAQSNVNALDWIHTDDTPTYPYDPKRAAALLDAAGWTARGPGGVRRNAGGERLSLELMSTAGNRSRELVQQVLQSQWKELGIDIRIRNQPARVFFGDTVTQRKFEAMALFAWISAPESVPRSSLHSAHVPTADNGWSGQNYTGFKNPEMDRLIEAIETELDRETRRGLWHRMQRLYASELPALPLYFRANAYILPKWLKGVTPTGHLGTTTLRIEEWRE